MSIETTDAFQLHKLVQAMLPHQKLEGQAFRDKLTEHGLPVVRQLQLNGHTLADALDLMRMTLQRFHIYTQGTKP